MVNWSILYFVVGSLWRSIWWWILQAIILQYYLFLQLLFHFAKWCWKYIAFNFILLWLCYEVQFGEYFWTFSIYFIFIYLWVKWVELCSMQVPRWCMAANDGNSQDFFHKSMFFLVWQSVAIKDCVLVIQINLFCINNQIYPIKSLE